MSSSMNILGSNKLYNEDQSSVQQIRPTLLLAHMDIGQQSQSWHVGSP